MEESKKSEYKGMAHYEYIMALSNESTDIHEIRKCKNFIEDYKEYYDGDKRIMNEKFIIERNEEDNVNIPEIKLHSVRRSNDVKKGFDPKHYFKSLETIKEGLDKKGKHNAYINYHKDSWKTYVAKNTCEECKGTGTLKYGRTCYNCNGKGIIFKHTSKKHTKKELQKTLSYNY